MLSLVCIFLSVVAKNILDGNALYLVLDCKKWVVNGA